MIAENRLTLFSCSLKVPYEVPERLRATDSCILSVTIAKLGFGVLQGEGESVVAGCGLRSGKAVHVFGRSWKLMARRCEVIDQGFEVECQSGEWKVEECEVSLFGVNEGSTLKVPEVE